MLSNSKVNERIHYLRALIRCRNRMIDILVRNTCRPLHLSRQHSNVSSTEIKVWK